MPCDMIEWRADKYLSAVPDLEEKLKQKEFYLDSVKLLDDINLIAEDIPIIFTIRSRSQGGDVQLSEEHMAGLRVAIITIGTSIFLLRYAVALSSSSVSSFVKDIAASLQTSAPMRTIVFTMLTICSGVGILSKS